MLFRILLVLILTAAAFYGFTSWQTGHFPGRLELRGLFQDGVFGGTVLAFAAVWVLILAGIRRT